MMDFSPHSSLTAGTGKIAAVCEDVNKDIDEWLDNHQPFSVVLMPRSLLIFKDEAYTCELIMQFSSACHLNFQLSNQSSICLLNLQYICMGYKILMYTKLMG